MREEKGERDELLEEVAVQGRSGLLTEGLPLQSFLEAPEVGLKRAEEWSSLPPGKTRPAIRLGSI